MAPVGKTALRYRGKRRHMYVDIPRLKEPYLFKESERFICNVWTEDAKYLIAHLGDVFTVVEPEIKRTDRSVIGDSPEGLEGIIVKQKEA